MKHVMVFIVMLMSATFSVLNFFFPRQDIVFAYSPLIFILSVFIMMVINNTRTYKALVSDLEKGLFSIDRRQGYSGEWDLFYTLTHKTSGRIITAYGDTYEPWAFIRMAHLEDPILPPHSGALFLRKVHAAYIKQTPSSVTEELFPWRTKDEKS